MKKIVLLFVILLMCGCNLKESGNRDEKATITTTTTTTVATTTTTTTTTTKTTTTAVTNILKSVKGYWYNKKDNMCVEFYSKNGKNQFIAGWVASEAYSMGEIKNLKKVKENIYQFKTDGMEFRMDLTNLKSKKIVVNGVDYIFIHENLEKGQEIVLEKYFN